MKTHDRSGADKLKEWQKPDSTECWNECVKIMVAYDESMVKGWKDELNNLLIFVRRLYI